MSIFAGYPSDHTGWQFWHPESRSLLVSNSVVFDERFYPGLSRTVTAPAVDWSAFLPDATDQVGDGVPGVAQRPLPLASSPDSAVVDLPPLIPCVQVSHAHSKTTC